MNCLICNSEKLTRIRTYKHFCYVCNDCNNLFHVKRKKYLLEWVFPRKLGQRIFPKQVFNYFFHKSNEVDDADFYSRYAEECKSIDERKKSEFTQLIDIFNVNKIRLDGKVVLDISGGPGYVGKELNSLGADCTVTEFSEVASKAMSEVLNIKTRKFDFNNDQLQDLFSMKFDIVMLRSSIIFCNDLDQLIASLKSILKPSGYVFLETILPTLGEVFWWQWMEYKFPLIYSQETIEKLFFKHNFSWVYGQRDYGSYSNYYKQLRKGFLPKLFLYIVEHPLVILYYYLAKKSSLSIDTKLEHKVLTHIWQNTESTIVPQKISYKDYYIGRENHSIHFGLIYNNYIKR